MSLTKSKESYLVGYQRLSWPGTEKKISGTIRSAGIDTGDGHILVAPVFIPNLAEVRAFAEELHREGKPWHGLAFGWAGHYEPKSDRVPPGSKAKFNPASFCLGEASAWCYCITWEHEWGPTEIVTDSLLPEQ